MFNHRSASFILSTSDHISQLSTDRPAGYEFYNTHNQLTQIVIVAAAALPGNNLLSPPSPYQDSWYSPLDAMVHQAQ